MNWPHVDIITLYKKKFEDIKGVIRIRKSKDSHYKGQKKNDKGQTKMYKTYT